MVQMVLTRRAVALVLWRPEGMMLWRPQEMVLAVVNPPRPNMLQHPAPGVPGDDALASLTSDSRRWWSSDPSRWTPAIPADTPATPGGIISATQRDISYFAQSDGFLVTLAPNEYTLVISGEHCG